MRKLSPYLSLITIILVGVGAFVMPSSAHAAVADTVLTWVTGGTDFVYGIFGKILWWLAVPLTGYVVWLTGAMIDQIIALSSDATFYNSDAIKNSWSILRDVANMTFIFILIFNGLKVILNQGNLATIKKVLGGVLLAAIFINFSLFFTKAVIDVSNITAAWFVQGIHGIGGTTSVSDAVMGTLQMSKLAQSPMNQTSLSNFSAQSFATGVAVMALNCVAAYVFFQVFFLLLARLVAFLVLLVTAPIGFVGFLLPQLEEYGSKWWKELQGQAMLAPVFFLMLYIGLYIIDQTDTFVFGSSASADPYTGSSFSAANYVMFAVIIALLLKILDVSKKYSGEMGGKIGGLLKSGIGFATGTIAMRTLGGVASAVKSSGALQRAAADGSFLAKQTLRVSNAAASSSFGVNESYGNLMASTGLKGTAIAGQFKGTDKGYSGVVERESKREQDFGKLLGKGKVGEENRLRYAQNLENKTNSGIYYNTIGRIGMERAGAQDAAGDIKNAAVKAYLKMEKEDSKKDAEKAKIELVYAEMRKRNISKALGTKDATQNADTLEKEVSETQKRKASFMADFKKVDTGALKFYAMETERADLVNRLGKLSNEEAKIAEARIKQLDSELGKDEMRAIEGLKLEKGIDEIQKDLKKYTDLKNKIAATEGAIERMSESLRTQDPMQIEGALADRRAEIDVEIKAAKDVFEKKRGEAKEKQIEYGGLNEDVPQKKGDDEPKKPAPAA